MVGRIKTYLYAVGFTACIFTSNNTSFSQDAIVNDYLTLVARGKVQDVKSKLPDLMVEYPNNAGVKLLLAVVLEDASKSVDIYKEIVKNYPDNIWADDAYWRLIQYYAITGDITNAKEELENFRNNYPTSPFLVNSGETVRFAESIIKSNAKLNAKTESKSETKKADAGEYSELKVTPKTEVEVKTEPKLVNKLDKFKPKTPSLEEVTKEEEKKTIDAKRPNLHLSANTDKTNKESHNDDDGHHSEGVQELDEHNDEMVTLKGEVSNDKTEEMSLEDEIKIRQNISKSLANDKLISEKAASEKAVTEKEVSEKNPLVETASTTTLTKIEGTPIDKNEEEVKTKTYGLQVSIYASQETAELEMKKYLKQRMRTEVKKKIVDGNKMYAVVIGNYSSRESAEGARGIVEQQCNCSPIIFEK